MTMSKLKTILDIELIECNKVEVEKLTNIVTSIL